MEHQDRVRRVVALLRTSEAFPARLDELLAAASDPETPSVLADILARLERLEAGAMARAESIGKAVARTARKPSKPPGAFASGDSADSEGGKKSNSLPAYVRDKVRDLIETNPEMKNPAIGKAVGISKESVRRIRNGLR
jgi:hypothetical protein